MRPSCSTMPPISWTSNGRRPMARLDASRTAAKVSGSSSSRSSPWSKRSRNSIVLAASWSSDSASSSGSSAFTSMTRCSSRFRVRPSPARRILWNTLIVGGWYQPDLGAPWVPLGSARGWLCARWLDQPVVAVPPLVDDVHLIGFGVHEDEEIMADQLQLEQRLLVAHRLHVELFRLDDHRLVLLGQRGNRRRIGLVGVVVGHVLGLAAGALLAVALPLPLELLGDQVDRRVHVGGRLPGAQHRALCPDRRLGHLAVADARVVLDDQLELAAALVGKVACQLAQLLLGVLKQGVGDIDVPAFPLQTHGITSRFRGS